MSKPTNSKTYSYTFSGWLLLVKGLSEEELGELSFNLKKYMRLSKQYGKYLDDEEKRFAEMEEKAIRGRKKGRRYSGKYKGRGKYKERDF